MLPIYPSGHNLNRVAQAFAATEDGSPRYQLDDFGWMDSWHVERKQRLRFTGLDKPVTGMAAEGIVVERAEASAALIYWDGKVAQVRARSPRGARGDVAKPWVTKKRFLHLSAEGRR